MPTRKPNNFKYTQKSLLTKYCSTHAKYAKTLYGHMFLEDMCSDFAIHFAPFSDEFFAVNPRRGELERLLEYTDYNFLRYDFSKLLSQNMYRLLLDGVCYVEIVLGFDEDTLKTIFFLPFDYTKHLQVKDKTKFRAINHLNKRVTWTIANSLLIKHDLKDLGIKRNYFRKILKGLANNGIPDYEWLNKAQVPFSDYQNRQILNALKTVGDTFWDLRNLNNEYINEIFLLYRRVKHDAYRLKFLEYLLSQYNQALSSLGTQYGFSGQITHPEIDDHKIQLEQLLKGEINCEKMGDYLFKFK